MSKADEIFIQNMRDIIDGVGRTERPRIPSRSFALSTVTTFQKNFR